MATHSGILSWRTPWTEKSGGLQNMGSQRIGHDRVTNTHDRAAVKNSPASAGDMSLIPGSENFPGEGMAAHSSMFTYTPILFIHSPVSEHFGCFHVLAVVNSAAVNIGVHVCF